MAVEKKKCIDCEESEIYADGIYCNACECFVGRSNEQTCVVSDAVESKKSMTESEVTKVIEGHIQFLRENWKPHPDYNVIEALGEAISALEEVEQYRAIGTVERFRELEEKATPKKPDYEADGYADGVLVYDYAKCPICGHDFEYGINDWGSEYCSGCGQKLDWSEGKE